MSNGKEIKSLTGLRGCAAIFVVFYHSFGGIPMKGAFNTLLAHGYLAVDIFFVLSGFVMTLNYAELFSAGVTWSSFRRFLGRRVARVYPLYVAATVCAALLLATGVAERVGSFRLIPTLAGNLAMIQSWGVGESLDAPSWSISAEWAAYLVFPLFLWIASRASGWKARVGAAVSVVALIILAFTSRSLLALVRPDAPFDIFAPYRAGPLLRCFPEFFLGVFCGRLLHEGGGEFFYTRAHVGDIVAASMLIALCFVRSDIVVVLLAPLLVLSLMSESNLVSRFLASAWMYRFGVLSYSIYLVHTLLTPLVKGLRHQLDTRGIIHAQTIASIPAFLLSYVLSTLAYRFVEKPGRRLLRDLFEQETPRAWSSEGDPSTGISGANLAGFGVEVQQ